MKYVDYYAALGLPRDADLAQIKKAYRALAHQYHPDISKAPDAEEKFKNAAAAYATLKNPEKRAAYDALGQQAEGADMDAPSHDAQYADMDLSDFLDSLGRGGMFGERHGRTRGPQRGQDMEDTVLVSLEQALHGTTLKMALTQQGARRELEVTIPAGVRAGQKLRLRGKGGRGHNGGADGDFYLHIALTPHARFRVDHQDLYFDLALSPWEAMLGAEVKVPTLDGEVLLTVPPCTGSGKKLRLRGHGMPLGTADKRSDMYALVRVDVPKHLSPQEHTLIEELSRLSTFAPRATPTGN